MSRNVKKSKGKPPSPSSSSARGRSAGSWLYGRHAVLAVIANPGRDVHQVLCVADREAEMREALQAAGRGEAALRVVERPELERHAGEGTVHQGVVARVGPLPVLALEDVIAQGKRHVLVVLDQVSDPQNVGAILRSAAAFGAGGVILPSDNAAALGPAVAKAASGALERVPICVVVNVSRTLEALQRGGYWCVGLAGEAQTDLESTPLPDRLALVMGAEGRGLRPLVARHCDDLRRIPIDPRMESLNVSVATAIALYAWSRGAA